MGELREAATEARHESRDQGLLRELNEELGGEARRLGTPITLDLFFLVFLRKMARFGFFTLGPISVDVHLIEEIVERTAPRIAGQTGVLADDYVRFSEVLMQEVRRSGRRRIDELHLLLAFMRVNEGLPARVFGELGVTPEEVEGARVGAERAAAAERLYSPEEAAEYLGVHVQTVRSWIRSGRLRAFRLTGQRALRIRQSDLEAVLEPVDPGSLAES